MGLRSLLLLILAVNLSYSMGNINVQSSQTHNSNCYTQGLMFLNRTHLFQSCGLYGSSFFHVLEYQATPFDLRESFSTHIPWKSDIFLQGSAILHGYIYLLTWQENKAYKLNSTSLQIVQEYSWNHEGWGLTTNKTHLFASDGSDRIYIIDENFNLQQTKQIKSITGSPQYKINEMQYVDGHIYANIYMQQKIVKINANSWKVTNQYDGSKLTSSFTNLKMGEVINGIAYDQNSSKFLITGKHWSKIYQVTFTQFENVCFVFFGLWGLLFYMIL